MKAYIIVLIAASMLGSTACKKSGCTNPGALNYSVEATEDDGSCHVPTHVNVKSIEVRVLKSTDENGVEWDAQGLPDCRVWVHCNSSMGNWGHTTNEINDVKIGETAVFDLGDNVVIPLDSLDDYSGVSIHVDDIDAGTSNTVESMAAAYAQLGNKPEYGSKHYSGGFRRRVELSNHSINGIFNQHVRILAVLEWE